MDYIDSKLSGVYSANELASEIAELQATKQDKLVSGTNIKTVNSNSLIGSGNVEIKESKLVEKLTATVSVGGIQAGTVFPADTSIEYILRELFKTSTGYTLYYGVSNNIPTTVESTWTSADIPEDFLTNGFTCYYTTAEAGREEGKYCAFVYPTNYGPLNHIYCNDLVAFDLIGNWTRKDITIDGLAFYLYYQNIQTKEENSKYQFLF